MPLSSSQIEHRLPSRATRRGLALRILPVLLVFLCGFISLQLGVGFSERTGDIPLLSRLYYTIGLFFLGGMDLGAPVGGPPFAQKMLWVAYFLAPMVTATALIEAAITTLNLNKRSIRRLRGHVIIGGGGRQARLFLSRLRQSDPRVPVLLVDHLLLIVRGMVELDILQI